VCVTAPRRRCQGTSHSGQVQGVRIGPHRPRQGVRLGPQVVRTLSLTHKKNLLTQKKDRPIKLAKYKTCQPGTKPSTRETQARTPRHKGKYCTPLSGCCHCMCYCSHFSFFGSWFFFLFWWCPSMLILHNESAGDTCMMNDAVKLRPGQRTQPAAEIDCSMRSHRFFFQMRSHRWFLLKPQMGSQVPFSPALVTRLQGGGPLVQLQLLHAYFTTLFQLPSRSCNSFTPKKPSYKSLKILKITVQSCQLCQPCHGHSMTVSHCVVT